MLFCSHHCTILRCPCLNSLICVCTAQRVREVGEPCKRERMAIKSDVAGQGSGIIVTERQYSDQIGLRVRMCVCTSDIGFLQVTFIYLPYHLPFPGPGKATDSNGERERQSKRSCVPRLAYLAGVQSYECVRLLSKGPGTTCAFHCCVP